jgi:hypothetical protein
MIPLAGCRLSVVKFAESARYAEFSDTENLTGMPDKQGKVQVIVKDSTIWCTQKAMAQLFGVGIPAISKHLKKKIEEGELQKEVVVSKMEIATQHGAIKSKTQKSQVEFYSLDAIISVGYRVNSIKATKFRQWATKVLREYYFNLS